MTTVPADHVWRVDDLCVYWDGIVCRVVEVKKADLTKPAHSKQHFVRLKIKQVFAAFGVSGIKHRTVALAHLCRPVKLIDLCNEHLKFANFITEETKRLSK